MTRDEAFIAACDRVNRTRALTDEEVDNLVEAIERQRDREIAHRFGNSWSTDEVKKLEKLLIAGMSFREAGRAIGRTRWAVSHAVRQLTSLPRRPTGRPRRTSFKDMGL